MEKIAELPETNYQFYDDSFLPCNYEQKCATVLVLDKSKSMAGEAIRELNRGLKTFEASLLEDPSALAKVELAIVTFGTEVRVIREFMPVNSRPIPEIKAGGRTAMIQALETSINLINLQKQWYKESGLQYYRPYIILMTDGSPWPEKNIESIKSKINDGVENNNFHFWAFGTGNANMKILREIAHPEFPPLKLKDMQFVEFFRWLGPSISLIAKSRPGDVVDIAPITANNPFQFPL